VRGTMLWFNEEKNLGQIEAEDGERFEVHGENFADGWRPSGRCKGTIVSFGISGDEPRRPVEVTLVPDVAPRRARRRHTNAR